MKINFVDLNRQYKYLKNEIDKAITDVIDNTAFIGTNNNEFVKEFEINFARYVGIKHCISCANGTDAIEIILKAIGIGDGDEVIIPAHTWISTAEAVCNMKAKPVFVDTLPDYYTIDHKKIEEKISKKTKAIVPVHLYGLPAEMEEILYIARKNNLKVIEDCAQAHGANYKGKKVGTLGDAAIFSFYPGKNLGAFGDAGCIVTNNDNCANLARQISNHGQLKKHHHLLVGRNSRMDGVQAAILNVKLPYLDKWNEQRRMNAFLYNKYFSNYNIKLPVSPEYSAHVYHLYVIRIYNRDRIQKVLTHHNISSAVHYPTPLPFLDAFKMYGHNIDEFPVSNQYKDKILSLPMFPELREKEIKYISDILVSQIS